MELLRRLILTAGFLYFFINAVSAQDYVKKKDAFQKSYIEEATGNFISAISSLKMVYDENSYEINLRLGWLNYLAGNFTESRANYSRAVALMPYAIEPKLGIVYPLSALGNTNEVIAQYEKILEITPNYSVVLHKLGLIYYGKGDYEKALKYFEKVVNLYPFDYDGLTMLGWAYFKTGNTREAKIIFQKALLNTPNGTSAIEGLELLK